jgi:predicted transcriptional regulator
MQAHLKSSGMNHDEFMRRVIQALIVFYGLTQKDIAKDYNVHEVALSEMLRGKRKWRKGLLQSLLNDLDCYEFFKEAGLI